jgi:antitoxin (DNA-binding transcriptional repressor) of toxin-antitoxin stability system
MEDVNLRYAKEHLEELLNRAANGEEVAIVDPAIGRVRLMPMKDMKQIKPKKRVLGHLEGKIKVPARLMEPMSEEELRDWYGDTE